MFGRWWWEGGCSGLQGGRERCDSGRFITGCCLKSSSLSLALHWLSMKGPLPNPLMADVLLTWPYDKQALSLPWVVLLSDSLARSILFSPRLGFPHHPGLFISARSSFSYRWREWSWTLGWRAADEGAGVVNMSATRPAALTSRAARSSSEQNQLNQRGFTKPMCCQGHI